MRTRIGLMAGLLLTSGSVHADDALPASVLDDPRERIFLCTPQGPIILQIALMIEGRPYRRNAEDVIDEHFRMIADDYSWNAAFNNCSLLAGRFIRYQTSLARERALKMFDQDGDGLVSRGELRSALFIDNTGETIGLNQSPLEPDWDDLVFSLIDMDGDWRLSANELQHAEAHLALADTNGDGALYPSEVAGAEPRRPSLVARTPVLLGRPASPARAVHQLRAHYADARGKIGRASFHIIPGLFDRLDADRDGELQDDELARIVSLPAHITLTADLQGPGAAYPLHLEVKGVSPELLIQQPAGTRLDNSRHSWSDELHLEIYGQRPGSATLIEHRVRSLMARYDADKNGYLDAAEVGAASRAYPSAAWDLNGDTKVFPDELEPALLRDSLVLGSCIQIEFHRRGPSLWTLLDANVDQILSERELRKLRELLAKLDANGDGAIAYHECPFAFEVQIRRGVRSDRSPRRQPLRPSRARLADSTPIWFWRMDANGDSDVSQREFLGTAEQFQRLDTDRDGLIDPREAEVLKP